MTLYVWLPVPNGDYEWNGSRVLIDDLLLGVGRNKASLYAGVMPPDKRLCQKIAVPEVYGHSSRPAEEMGVYDLVLAAINTMRDLFHASSETEHHVLMTRLDALMKEGKKRDAEQKEREAQSAREARGNEGN